MAAEIRPISSSEEMLAVQRQRYATYINELKYPDPHADHANRTIVEPQDTTGTTLGAFMGDELIGSVRISYRDFGEYGDLPSVRRFGPYFPDRLMLITKMVIEPPYRSGTLLARFGVELYRHTIAAHPETIFGVMSCVPSLQGFFLRFGYRPIGPAFHHSYAGMTVPMAVALYDLHHFRRSGSTVVKLCPRHDTESSDWFARTFAAEFESDACTSA